MLAIYDFEARVMLLLSLCSSFQDTRQPEWEKFNSNVAAKCEYWIYF